MAGRRAPREPVDLSIRKILSIGADTGRGNLVGIQPWMTPGDYSDGARLHAKLDAYLAAAREHGFLGPKTVVIFPEYLGAWLVVAHEKTGVYRAQTVRRGLTIMAASNPLSFVRWFASAPVANRANYAVFRMKAQAMAAIYQATFSRLASDYRVTIVAGSIVLPSPAVEAGVLRAGSGRLMNVSVVYGPDGKAQAPAVPKAFPIREERDFLSPGEVADIAVFATPAGRLGVLICADSWEPAAYRALKEQGAEIIAVPSYLFPDGAWQRRWYGYEAPAPLARGSAAREEGGANAPPRVDPADVGHIGEGEAWIKYSLPGRTAEAGARAGMVVFLRGHLWDLGSDGQTMTVLNGATQTGPAVEGAAIVNLWLGGG
jgi:predicted amidohydrolase